MRNQRLKAPKAQPTSSKPDGSGLGSSAYARDGLDVRGTPRPSHVVGPEAMAKVCGVAVAKLQGHSWTPTPSKGSRVNVGTISQDPFSTGSMLVGGRARRRLVLARWGGGPVVVRDRESRSHGEGVQRVRSIDASRGGRW